MLPNAGIHKVKFRTVSHIFLWNCGNRKSVHLWQLHACFSLPVWANQDVVISTPRVRLHAILTQLFLALYTAFILMNCDNQNDSFYIHWHSINNGENWLSFKLCKGAPAKILQTSISWISDNSEEESPVRIILFIASIQSVSCDRFSGYTSKHSRECCGQCGLGIPSQSESNITFER